LHPKCFAAAKTPLLAQNPPAGWMISEHPYSG
jgi:hypothetical protein